MAYRILVWNCNGIANSVTRRNLLDVVRKERPRLIFLAETLCDKKQIDTLKIKIGFDHALVKEKGQFSQGLALLWMNEVPVHIHHYSARHIDAWIGAPGDPDRWRFTGIYGYASTARRNITWNLMRHLHSESDLPWIIVGDFNELLCSREKTGGASRRVSQMNEFRAAVADCSLRDMGFRGSPFTWWDHQTKELLDRSLWSASLQALFPYSRTIHLPPGDSDHIPLLVELGRTPFLQRQQVKRGFRFEEFWARHGDCDAIVTKGWATPVTDDPMKQVCLKISSQIYKDEDC
ncbi:uncharacterized protein LOC133729894 [Rosa rugosa]|uniref:uncharacterized protein LOC133729894 n=1 Tax=Rosa rugosa TaxID=74645 RepID=UPI002B40EE2F|nr:uncharacterized protein LOC133729894 [Rosa rugosa]